MREESLKVKKQQEIQSRKTKESILCYVIVGIMAVSCFLPLWIAFVASISDETAIVSSGFSLLPRKPTLEPISLLLKTKERCCSGHMAYHF